MTTQGWLMLAISWGGILVLTGYCVWRTATRKSDDLAAPLDIEARLDRESDGNQGSQGRGM